MSHTKEPWSVAEESFDNDGIQESVIRGLDGRAVIAVTLDFGPNNHGMREANARRIVACVNACAGISTENLEDNIQVKELAGRYNKALRQRDELLAVMAAITKELRGPDKPYSADSYLPEHFIELAESAIAKVKECEK